MRIAIVAPSTPITEETAERVAAIAADAAQAAELVFDPQCFRSRQPSADAPGGGFVDPHNHYAGNDEVRAEAFVAAANDPAFDAIWFARGGYGACRIAVDVLARLGPAAREKAYLGYSDAGFLLAGLYKAGFPHVAHGPMPQDAGREGGEAAVRRALSWLTRRDADALEPGLGEGPAAAFNITVLGHLLGTALQPDLAGHVLLIEEVSEYMYAVDRAMFHLTGNPAIGGVAGIRLGRVSEVPPNDPDFGQTEEEVVRFWCGRADIPYLGRADIGHDSGNKVVPFGRR